MARTLLTVGLNHRTAPVEMRERLAYSDEETPPALARLIAAAPSVAEAALLSTCNRVEVITVPHDAAQAKQEIARFLAADRQVDADHFAAALYQFDGRDSVRHLFRVGASLDSMVMGEPQILGQIKLAYANAAQAGSVGMVLHRAFHKAFAVAKRVRNTTLIGHGNVSVSSAAVGLARQIFDSLADKTVMLMGAGKMAELTARQLARLGVESLLITNRTFDRAVALARELGGTAVPYDSYKPYLKIADIVIGSLSTTRPILNPMDLEAILRERRYRPMFLVDLGVPRNFHDAINQIDNVYLYDIDDLGAVVLDSVGWREREAQKAEIIVEHELDAFWRWLGGLELVPTIRDIRTGIEQMRSAELERHRAWLASLDPAGRDHVEALTRGIVNKIFHQVLTELRRGNGMVDGVYAAEIARRLLGGHLAAEGADDLIGPDDDDDDED